MTRSNTSLLPPRDLRSILPPSTFDPGVIKNPEPATKLIESMFALLSGLIVIHADFPSD